MSIGRIAGTTALIGTLFLYGCASHVVSYVQRGDIYSTQPTERFTALNAAIRAAITADLGYPAPEVGFYMTPGVGLNAFATEYSNGTHDIHLFEGMQYFSDDLIATVIAHEYAHIILNHHDITALWGRVESKEREADAYGIKWAQIAGFDACTLRVVEPSNEGRTKQIEELCK